MKLVLQIFAAGLLLWAALVWLLEYLRYRDWQDCIHDAKEGHAASERDYSAHHDDAEWRNALHNYFRRSDPQCSAWRMEAYTRGEIG